MPKPSKDWNFPSGFLWGAATSSHQVEGDNRWSDWWEFEQSGHLPHVSGEACRHYELYEQDFDMAQSWGHNAHRFSIEWSRIEPVEGKWNDDAVAHYRSVIRALLERGLEPVITLHHFTNPAWFARAGGWLHRGSATMFARYVEFVAGQLGKDVRYWLTINEPTVYVMQGYINGEWPPFLKASWIKAIIAFNNLAKAHVLAYRRLHQVCRNARVGFAHSAPVVMPCDARRKRDRIAAGLRDFILNRAFFLLIGASSKKRERTARCLDYIGINYYTRSVIRSASWGVGALLGKACHSLDHDHGGLASDIGWEIYPNGLRLILEQFSRFNIPLIITENGVATNDEVLRSEFLIQHLKSLAQALESGVNVIGYLYWSLVDNYEWALGTEPHFGLAAVDPITHERRPRPCAEDLKTICRDNRLEAKSIN